MKQRPPTRDSWAATLKANADRANAERGAKPRNRALVIVDIVAGILFALLALGVGISVAGSATLYRDLHSECTPSQVDGLTCNGTVLDVVTIGLIAIAILGFVLAAGMVLVNLIRRRWTFWWAFGAVVVMIALFWLGTWIVGMTLPAVAAS